MNDISSHLHQFGNCRLDHEKKILWFRDEPVGLPLKAVELLAVLVDKRGEVVTKDEIWSSVWQDSFVEETNLTHNIYLLRRTLKDLGEPDLIQTVPRRGYRFTGEVKPYSNGEVVIEKHSVTRTLVEEIPGEVLVSREPQAPRNSMIRIAVIAVVVMLGAGITIWKANTPAPVNLSSIAVLPLTSLDKNPDDPALGFGMADALITRLGKQADVRIVSTKTASRFLDTTKEPYEIGRELGVDGVLDGTLQRSNGRLQVTLRLIRSSDGVQIWSGLISDTEGEIFRLQDAIAVQTAQGLRLNLKQERTPARPTESLEAYNQFLKGDYLFRLRGSKNNELSIPFFKEAVRLDPNFARAWAGWAAALAMGTNIPEAEAVLEKALQRDPDLAEAHATRGFIQMFHYWNWPEAESSLSRAIELDPNSLQAHHWRGVYLSFHGRFDEARTEMERALDLDPVSVNVTSDLGQLYYLAGDSERAVEFCKRALSIDPEYGFAHGYLSRIYESQGKIDEAFEHYALGLCWNKADKPDCLDRMRGRYEKGGWREVVDRESQQQLTEIANGRAPAEWRSSTYHSLALGSMRVGNLDGALKHLRLALETKTKYETMNFYFPYLAVDPQFAGLRDDSRFHDILRQIRLQ